MTFIKMCGLRDEATVDLAVDLGVDAVGFVLADSPRRVSAAQAAKLRSRVTERTVAVGVYVKMSLDDIVATARAADLDHVQVHDLRSADDVRLLHDAGLTVIRAVNNGAGASVSEDLGADLLLVDGAVAGAGVTWDWQDRSAVPRGRWILAGGLTPENVARAVETSGAWGVDVSSGIESGRGIKSPELMTAFANAVRKADVR
ncbi:phosphoribosylanthranilate isomerase [Rhodococcus coprophilus]|uniref:N-(5'-phosphoribosyl)anthranilate isomerase n=1 Tax=Rhodococcus coprophilus TaxID=38310 RepID=A0A2X4UA11_9NOCA|nr:phosphoribosylanthranilate isomerase [Rhodococcus coprophilus]MBM7459420.1 phosphoribosylanthranilate isomerase [Rhodococcus coprophilus]SQI36013.1 phosphoribosylanthranilate isomerase [Rhodococcus coprophilus]